MTFYFNIHVQEGYRWPQALAGKGEAAVVMDYPDRVECGRLFATLDNYPYVGLDMFCDGVPFRATHRHSRLYWDGCVWTAQNLEDVRWRLPAKVSLVINGKRHGDVTYEEFERVVREKNAEGRVTTERCRVAIIDPRVRFLALASLADFDQKGSKAKCDLYARMNPTRDEALAALRRFGLDVPFGSNHATEKVVYGLLNDFGKVSRSETPAQILGRTIPIRVECSEPVDADDPKAGHLDLSLGNGQTGVVLRGVETVGGVRKTYAFRVPTDWVRKNVVSVIERVSVSPLMPTDREGYPTSTEFRIIKGDGVFSTKWGNTTSGSWHPLVRMAKKLRLAYDMLKEDAAADVEEDDPRLLCEFKIAAVSHVKGAEKACSLLASGEELVLVRDRDNPYDKKAIKVLKGEDGPVLGYVPKAVNGDLAVKLDSYCELWAKVESPCSHLGKPSASVLVVQKAGS